MQMKAKRLLNDLAIKDLKKLIVAKKLEEEIEPLKTRKNRLAEELGKLTKNIKTRERKIRRLCSFNSYRRTARAGGRKHRRGPSIPALVHEAHASLDSKRQGLKAKDVVGWIRKKHTGSSAAANADIAQRVAAFHIRDERFRKIGKGLYALSK